MLLVGFVLVLVLATVVAKGWSIVSGSFTSRSAAMVRWVEAIKAEGADLVTVVIGEFVPKWWQHGLHNHRALQMKARLLFEPGVAVVSMFGGTQVSNWPPAKSLGWEFVLCDDWLSARKLLLIPQKPRR